MGICPGGIRSTARTRRPAARTAKIRKGGREGRREERGGKLHLLYFLKSAPILQYAEQRHYTSYIDVVNGCIVGILKLVTVKTTRIIDFSGPQKRRRIVDLRRRRWQDTSVVGDNFRLGATPLRRLSVYSSSQTT